MDKFIKFFILALVFSFTFTGLSYAETVNFNVSLGYNSQQRDEVLKLQNFLYNLGYLKVAPTGLYLTLTQKAVADFQKDEGIVPAVGYFGPITRAVANRKAVDMVSGRPSSATDISIYDLNIGNSNNTASAILSRSKTITWKTTNYPADAGVNINLIRKSSGYPQSFSFIRSIAKNSANDGVETWTPLSGEDSSDVYVEVTCSDTYKYASGCHLVGGPVKVN